MDSRSFIGCAGSVTLRICRLQQRGLASFKVKSIGEAGGDALHQTGRSRHCVITSPVLAVPSVS